MVCCARNVLMDQDVYIAPSTTNGALIFLNINICLRSLPAKLLCDTKLLKTTLRLHYT